MLRIVDQYCLPELLTSSFLTKINVDGRYFLTQKKLAAAANAVLLKKSIKLRIWNGSVRETRQLPHIGKLLSERLHTAGLGKLRQLEVADPRRIETVTLKSYPFGMQRIFPVYLQCEGNNKTWEYASLENTIPLLMIESLVSVLLVSISFRQSNKARAHK